jgi:hypothetical protein
MSHYDTNYSQISQHCEISNILFVVLLGKEVFISGGNLYEEAIIYNR